MASSAQPVRVDRRETGLAKSLLELAPLELECMNALWPLGEGTVRDIQRDIAVSCPRAYTTIMTIMDRLAHKGVVTRRKAGRAWLYRPNLSADEARTHAIDRLVEGFFDGSAGALAAHLSGKDVAAALRGHSSAAVRAHRPPRAVADDEAGASVNQPSLSKREDEPSAVEPTVIVAPTQLDESLL